jgi:hypothetical protein
MNSERLPEPSRILRVINWNLAHRINGGAAREADLRSALAPDLALFQEWRRRDHHVHFRIGER